MDRLRELLNRLKNFWSSMSKERKRLIILLATALFVSIVLFVVIVGTPRYRLLVSGLSDEEAGLVTQKLEEMGIPYKVQPGGSVYIPDKFNVYEVRMRLASSGVLGGTRKGFTLLSEGGFGATSFDKQVRYQIALQEELEKSIMTIRGVRNARVHLVLPKYTYYVRGEMAEPRASVLVELEPGVELTKEQVKGIVQLVAGAVEGLKPENVKVIDNFSRVLSDIVSEEGTLVAMNRLDLKLQLERYYEKKLKSSLENVFGVGRVEVIPDVRLNWQKVETVMKKYEAPARREGLVRSQETETERSVNYPQPGGEVGTESNIPPLTYPSITPEGTSSYERTRTITNYELNEIYQKILENKEGEIASLSVAVIIDASSPTLNNDPEKWASVVNEIVEKGIASSSGPSLNVAVAFLPFDRSIEEVFKREREILEKRRRFIAYSLGIGLLGFLLFLFIYLLILQLRKIKARRLIEERRKKLEEEVRKVLEEEMKKEVVPPPEEAEIMQLLEELEEVFARSPSEIAEIVRLWFYERG